jgi:hypothetical protein
MKKLILTMVAMMTMSISYAETKSSKVENNVEHFMMGFMKNHDTRFDMSVDMRRLADKLDLNADQMEIVEVIQDNFVDEMQSVSTVRGPQRRHLVHEAVRKDIHQMQRILNDKQFNTYMMLLGATLQNKHL